MSEPKPQPDNGYFKMPAELLVQVNQILSTLPYGQVAGVMQGIGQCQHIKSPIQPDLPPDGD